jgi:hypothetical protein
MRRHRPTRVVEPLEEEEFALKQVIVSTVLERDQWWAFVNTAQTAVLL